jgi:hypothetical protein
MKLAVVLCLGIVDFTAVRMLMLLFVACWRRSAG